jgi:glucan phosphoethanolaminetransferase (alkaline phosphatase superfamily)
MVVAGVTLRIIIIDISYIIPLVGLIMLSYFLMNWYDSKKIIAFSTAVHLCVILLCSALGLYALNLIHIITHAFVKASAFVSSGVEISKYGRQDLRLWGISIEIGVMRLSFLLLARVGRSIIYSSKEYIVIQLVAFLIVIIGWNYTKSFFRNLSYYGINRRLMNFSAILLLFMRGSGFGGVDMMSVLFMVITFSFLINSISGYALNK